MKNKTLVVCAYILDEKYGSEPAGAFHFVREICAYFTNVIVLTSNLTSDETIAKLDNFAHNIKFVQTKFPFSSTSNNYGSFYLKYRLYTLRQASQIRSLNLDQNNYIGIHYSLSNHLLGTPFYKSGIPYLFGPASTSKFPFRYWRIAGFGTVLEILRNICVYLLLRFDPVVRRSLDNAEIVVAGDTRTQNLLRSQGHCRNLYSITLPHTSVELSHMPHPLRKWGEKKDLIWCGAFKPQKNPKLALEIMRSIRDDYGREDLSLVMYGSGKKLRKLEKYRKRFNLQNVQIRMPVEKEYLLRRIDQARVLIFTSYRESGGAQILEAIAAQTSVVSTDATAATEWLKGECVSFVGPSTNSTRSEFVKLLAQRVLTQYDSEFRGIDLRKNTVQGQVNRIFELLDLFQ